MKKVWGSLVLGLCWAAPAWADTYTCNDQSLISFTAFAPIRKDGVRGESHTVLGKIQLPDGKLDAVAAGFAVPITSFAAKSGLDQHTFEAVEAAKYPAVMFRSKQVTIESTAEGPDGTHLTGTISGLLNFHGVKRALTCKFTALQGPGESTLDTEFPVSLTDYGIDRPQIMFIKVDDVVQIGVHLVAIKQP